jgi:hypothetical protein
VTPAAARHQEQRDTGVVVVATAQVGRHDEGIGLVARRHDALHACQAVGAARGGRAGGDPVEVIARAALLVCQHDQRGGVDHLRQPFGLQRLGRMGQQRRGDQRTLCQRGVDQAAAQFFHHHHRLDRTEAHAAMRVGHGQRRQAQLGQLAVDLARAATGLCNAVPALERKTFVDPAGHRVAQRNLVVGKIKVHVSVLLSI